MKDIHPTAIVSRTAKLGDGVRVGAFCVIKDGAQIGAGTELKEFCLVGKNAQILEGCSIGAYTEIRADCSIENRVRLGSKCLLADGTVIGNDSHCSGTFTTCNKPEPGEHNPCYIGPRFYAGVGVRIMPNVVIGEDVKVGASSTVRHDIPHGEVWFGNPARKHR